MNLAEIQHAIQALPVEQQASLAVWLSERDRLQWDLELEQDFSAGGAGMALLDGVRAQVGRGASKPMSQGRERRGVSYLSPCRSSGRATTDCRKTPGRSPMPSTRYSSWNPFTLLWGCSKRARFGPLMWAAPIAPPAE